MPSSNDTTELLTLCGKVRDGEITSAEFARLEARLLEDPQALDIYRRFMAVCSGLEQTAVVRQSAPERRRLVAELDSATEVSLPPKHAQPRTKKYFRRRKVSVAVAAIAAVAAVFLFAFFHSGGRDTSSFATVASMHQPVWSGERTLEPNRIVEEGEYSLARPCFEGDSQRSNVDCRAAGRQFSLAFRAAERSMA